MQSTCQQRRAKKEAESDGDYAFERQIAVNLGNCTWARTDPASKSASRFPADPIRA